MMTIERFGRLAVWVMAVLLVLILIEYVRLELSLNDVPEYKRIETESAQ